jgi:hypothetical protein
MTFFACGMSDPLQPLLTKISAQILHRLNGGRFLAF